MNLFWRKGVEKNSLILELLHYVGRILKLNYLIRNRKEYELSTFLPFPFFYFFFFHLRRIQ